MSDALISALSDTWKAGLRARRSQFSGHPPYVYASGIRSCTRAMALDITHPEDQEPFSDEALARMKRGEEREAAIVAWLHQIGPRCSPPFAVTEGQRRFEIKDRDGTILIVGKVDCRLKFENGERPYVEVKSGESFKGIETLDDFERSPWTRHAPDQLLSYLYAENQPWGLFVLDGPGLPRFVRVDLEANLARIERTLGAVRRAIDVKLIDAPLPPYTEDRSDCRRCQHFKKSCTPELDYGEGMKVITDQALLEAAITRERHRAAHEEYEAADKRLKESLRGVEAGLLGDFQVSGKWSPHTTYEIPEELKPAYRKVNPEGRFTLKIERIA